MANQLVIPRDGNSAPLQEYVPSVLATSITAVTNASNAVVVAVATGATMFEVNAISQAMLLKWGGTVTATSFDECVVINYPRHYFVPSGATMATFLQQASSGTLIVIQK